MEIFFDLKKLKNLKKPIIVTIGNFDALHLGHAKLLNKIVQKSKSGTSIVISFRNHTSTILKKEQTPEIINLDEKVKIFKKFNINCLVFLEFTKFLAKKNFKDFLKDLKEEISFDEIVFGKGATFGKNRDGDEKNVQDFGSKNDFKATYIEKLIIDNISSASDIRSKIFAKSFLKAKTFLGRSYSIYVTDNLLKFDSKKFCIPPSGKYFVTILKDEKSLKIEIEILDEENFKILKFLKNISIKQPYYITFNEK